jgi:hypothetical protein
MSRVFDRIAPWAGLAAGALAWIVHQQLLSDVLRFDCAAVSPARAVAALAIALALCFGGAGVSWYGIRVKGRTGSGHKDRTGPGHAFVGWLSVFSAAVFALAIALQAMASLTVPGCFR